MRGELGAFLGADSLRPLGGEVAPQPPQKRRQDQPQRDNDDHGGERGVAQRTQDVIRREEEQGGAHHQQYAEDAAVEVGDTGARTRGRGRRIAAARRWWWRLPSRSTRAAASPLRGRSRAAPKQRRAKRSEHERPDQRVAPPDAELAEREKGGQRQQPDAGRDSPVTANLRQATKPSERRPSSTGRRQGGPGDEIDQQHQPAGRDDGDHEQDPKDHGVDAHPPTEPREHPSHQPAPRVAVKRGGSGCGAHLLNRDVRRRRWRAR